MKKNKKLIKKPSLRQYFNPRSRVLYNQESFTWIKPPSSSWTNIQQITNAPDHAAVFLSFFQDIQDIYVDKEQNFWVVGDNDLYKINAGAMLDPGQKFRVLISSISHKRKPQPVQDLRLNYKNNSLKFQIAAPFFLRESKTQYRYAWKGWMMTGRNGIMTMTFLLRFCPVVSTNSG